MGRKTVRSASVTVTYSVIRADQIFRAVCGRCRARLDLHQPVPEAPTQLLATCPTCHAWYRVEIRPGEPQGVLVALPDVALLMPSPVVVAGSTQPA